MKSILTLPSFVTTTTDMTQFRSNRPSVPVCSLKNKELDSVARCSGPRRRYAKKVGDRVGTTLDGGDAPILIFSFGGAALTIALGIWAVNNL